MAIIVVALGSRFGIQAVIVKPYRIPSGSMEPTLKVGQRVLVNRIGDELQQTARRRDRGLPPAQGASSKEQSPVCGPVEHVVKFGGAACAEPVPRKKARTSSSGSSPGPATNIYVKEGHVYRKAAGKTQFVREKDSYIRECGASPGVQLPDADQDSAPDTGS